MYDVIIMGSGIAGTVMAAILAKENYKVLILEKRSHPRFAIGEALLPQSALLFKLISERYGIPEIGYLSRLEDINEHISKKCGKKRSLGFVYHAESESVRKENAHLLVPPEIPLASESHLFREDVDFFFLNVAKKYGAEYKDHADIKISAIEDDYIEVIENNAKPHKARFLIDACGVNSPLSEFLNLKEEVCSLETKSRSIFTHMENVRDFSEIVSTKSMLTADWRDGTLHHIFDGGWMWIIPFDNHELSQSNLCSVGLNLDINKYPENTETAENEFQAFVDKFPDIMKQFENARPVRPWVKTKRLQYQLKKSTGKRWLSLSHSYGFIDALFSRGLISTCESINQSASILLDCLKDDSFSESKFNPIDRLQKQMLQYADKMVATSYKTFSSPKLLSQWLKVWLFSKIYGDIRVVRYLSKYYEKLSDPSVFDLIADEECVGSACPNVPAVQEFINKVSFDFRELSGLPESEMNFVKIERHFINNAMLPPVSDWEQEGILQFELTGEKLRTMFEWGKTEAPDFLKNKIFDFEPAF